MKKTLLIAFALVTTFGLGYAFNSIVSKTSSNDKLPKRVTGVGGIFFKCKDPNKVKEWYTTHLGFNTDKYGTNFEWREGADTTQRGYTQWSPFSEKTKYFDPSTKDFMINYRVADLKWLVGELKKEGVTICDTMETYDYGKFIHILDVEGNKIELWEPVNHVYETMQGGVTK